MAGRALISKLPSLKPSSVLAARAAAASRPLHRLRPLLALADTSLPPIGVADGLRCFSTRPTTSSLNDPSPNWSNRPPKETILLDGCDFEHWLVVMEPPDPNCTRDEIIDSYIKILAQVVGSEDEARMKIYSVSTKHYFAFGALVSEELSYKIKAIPKVRWVLPDSYLDVKNKDYGGEPFIDGKAVPYDPKYHEEWVRNNARANERSRRNDRPRDRSRNFERRRENMQTYQNRDVAPMPNQGLQNPMPPRDMSPPMPSNTAPSAMPPRDVPPMDNSNMQNTGPAVRNRDFNAMPPNNANSSGPVRTFQNQMPNTQNSFAPNDGRVMPPGPPLNGNNQGYQGSNPIGGMQVGPGYQGHDQGYQGGSHGYQSGAPNYQQGGAPNYQQGSGPNYPQQGGGLNYQPAGPNYQPAGPNYQPGSPNYQQAGPNYQPGSPNSQPAGPNYQSGSPNYQPAGPNYQPGSPNYQPAGPNYQPGSPNYQPAGPNYQPGSPNYKQANPSHQSEIQGGVPAFQGRDMPGRD